MTGERITFSADAFIGSLRRGEAPDIVGHFNRFELSPWKEREEMPVGRSGVKIIEIIGLPEAGKTTGFRFLQDHFDTSLRSVFIPELQPRSSLSGQRYPKGALRVADRYGLEHENVVSLTAKLISTAEAARVAMEFGLSDAREGMIGKNGAVIIERGVMDTFPFHYWSMGSLRGKDTLPYSFEDVVGGQIKFDSERYSLPETANKTVENFAYALGMAQLVDAVVLYGTPQDISSQRRVDQGLEPEGRLNNSRNWPMLERGCAWWLGSIYPYYRQNFGTGLLVLDGTNDLEENNQKLLNFCEKVSRL